MPATSNWQAGNCNYCRRYQASASAACVRL